MDTLMTDVAALLAEVACETILPVYRHIEANPQEVTPGEWVTSADFAAEAALIPRLQALLPDSVCVAEEASKDDPRVLERLGNTGRVWLIDPLDGTSSFAQGKQPFRSMLALMHDGQAVASWIHDPISGSMAIAERGSGAWLDGAPIRVPDFTSASDGLRGSVLRRFLSEDVRARADAAVHRLGAEVPASMCAGSDYVALAQGPVDYVLYWRTLPWDHIPGALFLTEAGGVVRRLDGHAYAARTHAQKGLLAARSGEVWALARAELLPPLI